MHQISIKFSEDIDQNELWHTFYELLGYLRHNGQLLGRNMVPYMQENQISATFQTFTAEALNEHFFNKYVSDSVHKLEKFCHNRLIINHVGFGEDEQSSECKCIKYSYFLLMYHREYSPIVCGTCNKSVPLHRMPKLHDFGYWTLTNWQNVYFGAMLIDLNCGTGERWAMKQQTDFDSGLSKQGLELCQKISETTGIKTYYFLANFAKRTQAKDIVRPCPSCGDAWHLDNEIHGYVRFKCDKCLLMSSYSSNWR